MKILYGTTNQGKLESMNRAISSLGIEIIGLKELNKPIPVVNETGKSPLENAIIKANVYYHAFQMPVFSCDSGLFFDNVEDSLQPGTHIRRINGKELTDDEMIEYYANLSKRFNNQLIGRYKNAISFVYDEKHIFNSMDQSLMGAPILLIDKPHEKRVKGFPLDSISVDCNTKQYYFDLENKTVETSAIDKGFKDFFVNALSKI